MKSTSAPKLRVISPAVADISPVPNLEKAREEELNKKIENLQNQFQASQQRQNVLEQRVSDLMSLLKRIFPFFK